MVFDYTEFCADLLSTGLTEHIPIWKQSKAHQTVSLVDEA